MLKTNSKQARENVRQYIRDNTDFCGYSALKMISPRLASFPSLAIDIMNVFRTEKRHNMNKHNEFQTFLDWTQGLPSALDCCYWYNRPAVDDLGDILEQTGEERSRYDEEQAGQLLTWLIYRELSHAEREYYKEATK